MKKKGQKTEQAVTDFFTNAANEKDKDRKKWKKMYKKTWGTKIGKDCVSLDSSLAKWLGERLLFLAKYTNSYPSHYHDHETWTRELKGHGKCLIDYYDYIGRANEDWTPEKETAKTILAKESMHWVAENLSNLWD